MNRIDTPQGRFYETPAGLFPSVTTILDATMPQERINALAEWEHRVGVEEAERIRQEAAERGEVVHMEVERYAEHGVPGMTTWFQSLEWYLQKVERVQAIERPLWSALGYAGTVDLVAYVGEFLVVDDWKTSGRRKRVEWVRDHILQVAGYAIAYEEREGVAIDQLHVLVALEDADAQIFGAFLPHELEEAKQEFLGRLAQWKEMNTCSRTA